MADESGTRRSPVLDVSKIGLQDLVQLSLGDDEDLAASTAHLLVGLERADVICCESP